MEFANLTVDVISHVSDYSVPPTEWRYVTLKMHIIIQTLHIYLKTFLIKSKLTHKFNRNLIQYAIPAIM